MLEDITTIGTGLIVVSGIVFGAVITGLGIQFATNLSRNMSLTNNSATQGLKANQ